MKILVVDNEDKFEPIEVIGCSSIDIEKKLLDWFLECSDFDATCEMIEDRMSL